MCRRLIAAIVVPILLVLCAALYGIHVLRRRAASFREQVVEIKREHLVVSSGSGGKAPLRPPFLSKDSDLFLASYYGGKVLCQRIQEGASASPFLTNSEPVRSLYVRNASSSIVVAGSMIPMLPEWESKGDLETGGANSLWNKKKKRESVATPTALNVEGLGSNGDVTTLEVSGKMTPVSCRC